MTEEVETEWTKDFTVVVRGARNAFGTLVDSYYSSKGPAFWKIDDLGNLHIQYYSIDGADIPLATHLHGTWISVSQSQDEETEDEEGFGTLEDTVAELRRDDATRTGIEDVKF